MLKRVLALPGQTVCRNGLTITVDNIATGEARERDSRGRPLPEWQGCRLIAEDEVSLMNWQFGGLPRWAIFRGADDNRDHRAGAASLHRRGRLIMSPDRNSFIPLFGQSARRSSVPAKHHTAIARSGGPGLPSGRRASASPLTAASTMAALRSLGTMLCIVVILAASILSSGTAHADQESSATQQPNDLSVRPFAALVTEASKRFRVPQQWIRAVMHVESSAKQRARSSKGAMGLMQIMPKTWTELRARYGLGADPFDPRDNILAGAAYIRELYDRSGTPGFVAAYNAGPGRYERHLAAGRPLPDETQAYVATLAPMINRARTNMQIGAVARSFAWANSSLFATRTAGISSDRSSPTDMRQNRSSRAHGSSTYWPSYPTLATYSYTVAARWGHDDRNRISSWVFGSSRRSEGDDGRAGKDRPWMAR
jgi:soluble lytic murein transglycosylase-like protein